MGLIHLSLSWRTWLPVPYRRSRRLIALVAVVKKSRRFVRAVRFGLTVFGRIIVADDTGSGSDLAIPEWRQVATAPCTMCARITISELNP